MGPVDGSRMLRPVSVALTQGEMGTVLASFFLVCLPALPSYRPDALTPYHFTFTEQLCKSLSRL